MDRREALRLLATGAVIPLAPHNLLSMLRDARAQVGTQTALRTLNPHQAATLRAMTEMILPRTDTPGATDVGVTEFIDLILTEWYEVQDRTRFLSGLADVDSRTQAMFGKNFVEASPLQQADILTSLGEKMIEAGEVLRVDPRQRRVGSSDNFYSWVRRWTLTAYYTSEAGATAELHFEIIPDRHDGCAELPAIGGPARQ